MKIHVRPNLPPIALVSFSAICFGILLFACWILPDTCATSSIRWFTREAVCKPFFRTLYYISAFGLFGMGGLTALFLACISRRR